MNETREKTGLDYMFEGVKRKVLVYEIDRDSYTIFRVENLSKEHHQVFGGPNAFYEKNKNGEWVLGTERQTKRHTITTLGLVLLDYVAQGREATPIEILRFQKDLESQRAREGQLAQEVEQPA